MTSPIQSQDGTSPPFSFPNSYGTSPTNAPAGTPQVVTQEEDEVELVGYPSTRPSPGQLSPAFAPPTPNESGDNPLASRVTPFPSSPALTPSPMDIASPPTPRATPIMLPSLQGNPPINSAVVTIALATLSLNSAEEQQRAPSSTSSRSESAATTPGSRESRRFTLAHTPIDYVQE